MLKSWLLLSIFIYENSSHAADYQKKVKKFYPHCLSAKQNWSEFQDQISTLVQAMPENFRTNIDIFLIEDQNKLNEEETIGAFSADLMGIAETDKLCGILLKISDRTQRLFNHFKVPSAEINSDSMLSFLSFTILQINNPFIYSTLTVLLEQQEKGLIAFYGEDAGMLEYLLVTLVAANQNATQILEAYSRSKKPSWLSFRKKPTQLAKVE